MPNSANLRLEIKEYKLSQQDAYVIFKNGSRIKVVTAGDTARGGRANILVCDEFRLVDYDTISTVLRKFLTSPRQPRYLTKPEYSHLAERNKELYLSSAWYKSHWSFEKAKAYAASMLDDTKKYFVCGLPYQLSIKEGLLMKEQVEDEMSESDFNDITWMVEMECLFFGDTDGSLYTYEDILKTRQLKTAIYPPWIVKNSKIPDLAYNERRILSADIALMASSSGHNNDAASIWINSALPTSSNKYIANMIYTENHEDIHTADLALIIRRLFEIYKCTDLVLDTKSMGIGIYDALTRDIYDPEFGVTYSPLNCCNNELYAARCADKSAPKVIWAINGSSTFNSEMYLLLREAFKQRNINLLIPEYEFDEYASGIKGYSTMSAEDKVKYRMPYVHTSLLSNELINLEYEARGAIISVKEKGGARKDRVSSVGYNYWVMKQIEVSFNAKIQREFDPSLYEFKAPKIKRNR